MSDIQTYLKQASSQLWLVIILLIVLPPLGIYLLWQGQHFDLKKRKIITGVSVAWMLLYLIDASMAPSDSGYEYGSCSATFYENGCTYYRDDDCNVVAKSCG